MDVPDGLELYTRMCFLRYFEERVDTLYRQGLIHGPAHLGLGQEAIAVGAASVLRPGDCSLGTYRGHAHALARGAPPDAVLAELLGREGGICAGKGGSMHITSIEHGYYGSYAIVGAHLPIACGLAWAAKIRLTEAVTVCFFGDGTTNIGAFHEAVNLAAVWRLPVVFVCENNWYMEYTPIADVIPVALPAADRAAAYGLDRVVVDGNDVTAVYETTRSAVNDCRAGKGPVLLEMKTMRMKGHAQHDPAEYVPKAMFEYWKARDPIARYAAYLTEHRLWDPQNRSEIDARIERELDEDQKFAEQSPLPLPEQAKQGVYCEGCHTVEAEWKRPKKEVMPPAASVEAVWKVADFGGLGAEAEEVMPLASAGTKGSTRPLAPRVEDIAVEHQQPLRVPFGRGPKDRAFERERQEKQPSKPPRHKRRRR